MSPLLGDLFPVLKTPGVFRVPGASRSAELHLCLNPAYARKLLGKARPRWYGAEAGSLSRPTEIACGALAWRLPSSRKVRFAPLFVRSKGCRGSPVMIASVGAGRVILGAAILPPVFLADFAGSTWPLPGAIFFKEIQEP